MAPPAPKPLRTIFATLALVLLLASLDQTIVSTALPTIAGELGGLTHLSWVVTAYLLTSTIVGPLYGKFGDLYGRKAVLQTGIVIFLIGSILSGLAQDMVQLIVFRTIQGIGGGGLIVTVLAVVGDLIPPRERGKYQGLFAAVFSLSTLLGPLFGGFFVDHLSWRWIFYVNVPLGILALVVIGVVFESPPRRRRPAIDYGGAATLSLALSGIILFVSLGGSTLPWTSPALLGLLAVGLAAAGAFILFERRAQEPILPLDLFRNRTFALSCVVAFVVGFSLFGSTTYLPIYMQVVKGVSPTESGLQLMPMMIGLLISSVTSGRLISRWGRYKPFPIVGTALMTVGLAMLSRLSVESAPYQVAMDAAVMGLGMGMIMQVLTMAVQNNVDYKQLGVATAGTSFFRAIGGAVGVAVFGAIFSNGLHAQIAGSLDFLAAINPSSVRELPEGMRAEYAAAVMAALQPVFVVACAVAAVGHGFTWFIRETPLRGVAPAETITTGFPMPRDASSVDELARIIDNLASKENRWRLYADIAERAGVDLSPSEIWLLYRMAERGALPAEQISTILNVPMRDVARPLGRALQRGLIMAGADGVVELTPRGVAVRDRLIAARQRRRDELLERWEPDKHPEARAQFARLAEVVSRELPQPPVR